MAYIGAEPVPGQNREVDDIFWYMLNAIKELSAKVTALEAA